MAWDWGHGNERRESTPSQIWNGVHRRASCIGACQGGLTKGSHLWYSATTHAARDDTQAGPNEEVTVELINRVVTALFELHPWHAMVVHFPIALTSVALLSIVLALWRRNELFEQFAFFNIVLAAVSTAVAGLAGLRDHFVRFEGDTPYVNVKIFLGVSLLLLTTVMSIGRFRNADLLWNPSSKILYVAAYVGAFLLAAVLGFVGGSILYGF